MIELPFKDQDRISLTYGSKLKGTVVRGGIEVSEIKLDGGAHHFINNQFLKKEKA